tara:strand:- start:143 stop:466 length:324 start_codon:yes stop_codon:yes gene_type:complete
MTGLSNNTIQVIAEAVIKIRELGHEEFIRTFNNASTGFMWNTDNRLKDIGNALDFQGHSGASFALTLRGCQSYFSEENDINMGKSNGDDNYNMIKEKINTLMSRVTG